MLEMHRFGMLAMVLCTAAACSGTDTISPAATPSVQPDQTHVGQPATEDFEVTTLRITVDNRTIDAQIDDNPTAQDLAEQLPLTLTFHDMNGVEKFSPLPRKLSVEGMPPGDDPEIGDIGYWAPDGNLVFYYGDVGYWNGIVRIGRFNTDDLNFLKGRPDGFQVRIERG